MSGYQRKVKFLMQMVIDSLHGKDLEEVIAEGSKLLAGVPSLSGSGVSADAPSQAAEAAAETKAESKPVVEEEEDDSDADMGLGLFDD
jgi:large subunit ribosomal protein LP2